jgi:ABC-2 type transport system permease protein
MSTAVTIARRELGSYFHTPAGWIIIALYAFLTGIVFAFLVLSPGAPAGLRPFFAVAGWLLLPVAPAVTMRLIAEELRTGSIESILTAPVSSTSLVLGKYLGAVCFLAAMMLPTLVYVGVVMRVANAPLDFGPILSGYLCLALLGMMYLAIGTLASSLTPNATLAFMATMFTILALLFAPWAADFLPAAARPVIGSLSLADRIGDFAKGVIDTGHVVFFLSAAGWFLLLAVIAMEVRRWR